MADLNPDANLEELMKKRELLRPKYAEITFKSFLEDTPPDTYTYLIDLELLAVGGRIATPEIVLFCPGEKCSGARQFQCGQDLSHSADWSNYFLKYICCNCRRQFTTFAIRTSVSNVPTGTEPGRATALKLGQSPSFGPQVPTRLITLIGPDREVFLQGRRAENRGMGIGAFAYYRRVVENQKNRIISEIAKVAKVLGSTPEIDSLFAKAINETRFSESVNMVKSLIPQALLINGHNPLTLLHSALSKGLHDPDMTDDHCLALATSIRTILAELAERSSEALKNDKEIQSALSVLMALPSSNGAKGAEVVILAPTKPEPS